jgi:hypothetical protein
MTLLRYAKERIQFDKPIRNAITAKLAEMQKSQKHNY